MKTLTDGEKRTIRLASIGLGIYLALFLSLRGWNHLQMLQRDYDQMQLAAQKLQWDLQLSEDKIKLHQQLKENFHIDFSKLSRTTLVAEASGAIQKFAMGSGIQLGPIRESPGRPAFKELAAIQLQAEGPPPMIFKLIHKLEVLGYPIIVDTAQLSVEPSKPGMVKVNLSLTILDYKPEEAPPCLIDMCRSSNWFA